MPCVCARQRTFGHFAVRIRTAKTAQTHAGWCLHRPFAVREREQAHGNGGAHGKAKSHGKSVKRTAKKRAREKGGRTAKGPRRTAKSFGRQRNWPHGKEWPHGKDLFVVLTVENARQRSFAGQHVAVRYLPCACGRQRRCRAD